MFDFIDEVNRSPPIFLGDIRISIVDDSPENHQNLEQFSSESNSSVSVTGILDLDLDVSSTMSTGTHVSPFIFPSVSDLDYATNVSEFRNGIEPTAQNTFFPSVSDLDYWVLNPRIESYVSDFFSAVQSLDRNFFKQVVMSSALNACCAHFMGIDGENSHVFDNGPIHGSSHMSLPSSSSHEPYNMSQSSHRVNVSPQQVPLHQTSGNNLYQGPFTPEVIYPRAIFVTQVIIRTALIRIFGIPCGI